ncbi:hypothetical protein LRS06_01420 [Hymenobacter sp. J193]|uniref:hypothetical protein n=1 Tax=Hymenobacter sp. J193 TaxID=2898429 RepID=UPI002151361E|nr:hypothetical protein [Hymenobacter sp. J193]MCR5886453.1 hypothetical protein [Hymenobacter sp. J193]
MVHAFLFSRCFTGQVVCLGVLGLTAACTPQPETSQPAAALPPQVTQHFDAGWAQNKWWDDGLAEVATYAAERTIYQKPRQFEYTLITVKEDFNREFNSKTDDYQRPDLFPVMKVNQFCRIPTDNYPYHFLTSLFFRREQPTQLHKLTTSSQEWCGTTFKALTAEASGYQQTYNSYWDGQGAGTRHLPGAMLFEDGLPYTLRSLRFARQPAFTVPVCELQQTSKAAPPVVYQAKVTVTPADPTETPEAAWQVQVQLDSTKQNRYWFARRYPHVLLRQTTWDGRSLTLRQVRRYAYWQH